MIYNIMTNIPSETPASDQMKNKITKKAEAVGRI